jgi:hypothetical protein
MCPSLAIHFFPLLLDVNVIAGAPAATLDYEVT